jgi:radical SAM superfamily enzyme YgiQ (UPF0313 family)|tara:strand:- start:190 stop:1626 length:1437 start_codon:yes stop_codon:yes gene_type:complete
MGFYNRYFPYGLLTLATSARNHGHIVSVYNADLNNAPVDINVSNLADHYDSYLNSFREENNTVWKEVENTITSFQADMIGIQVYTDFAASAFHIAEMSKKIDSKCVVVMGGPHITVKADEVIKICSDVDYLIKGEGEQTLNELIDHLVYGTSKIDTINGLAFRKGNKVFNTPNRDLARGSLDVPFPDRSLLMNEKHYSSEDLGLLMTARGCPFKCTFCVTERNTRFRTVDSVIEEIKEVQKRYGTKQFTLKDDTFTLNKKRVREFCERLIFERIRIVWECNTRVDSMDEPLIKLMKKSGCIFIKVGIETGSERILSSMQKKITFKQIKEGANLFKKYKIHWTGYFMIGVPGETREDMEKTLSFMYELNPDFAYVGVYQPYPGSQLFRDGVANLLVNKKMSRHDFFNMPPNQYYKANPTIQLDIMSETEFKEIEIKIKTAFYNYNKNIFRLLKMALAKFPVYFNNPRNLLADFKKYLSY